MKQQILNLKKKLLIVERNPESIFVNDLKEIPFRLGKMFKLTDITEELFAEWVKSNILYDYADYTNNEICILPTAKESFFSYLEKEGVWFENPLGTKESVINFPEYGLPSWIKNAEAWQEAEEKVWNLNNCYIFEIL